MITKTIHPSAPPGPSFKFFNQLWPSSGQKWALGWKTAPLSCWHFRHRCFGNTLSYQVLTLILVHIKPTTTHFGKGEIKIHIRESAPSPLSVFRSHFPSRPSRFEKKKNLSQLCALPFHTHNGRPSASPVAGWRPFARHGVEVVMLAHKGMACLPVIFIWPLRDNSLLCQQAAAWAGVVCVWGNRPC